MEMGMRMERLTLSDPDHFRQEVVTPSNPSARLPTELLSEIFLLCVDGVMDMRNTIYTPLLLSKICSRWRSAAIANPQLWARLFLQLSELNLPHQNQTALVNTWMERSGACPLTVYVFWEEQTFLTTHPVLDVLMEHSTRWHTMFFYLPFLVFRSFSRVRNRLPLLTDLSLGTDDEDISSATVPEANKLDMWEHAPRLRSLECVNFSPTVLKFPWAQLQDIPVLAVNIDEGLDILHRAKRLDKVGFIFVDGGNVHAQWQNAQHPYVYHNHLRCFTLMTPPWNESVSLRALFPHLAFPHLESLTICNLKSPFGPEFTQFLSQLHVLKTLHLRKTALSDEQLVEGLRHLPTLTCLIVHSKPTVTRYLLDALTRNFFSSSSQNDDGMLLPRLKKLELTLSSHIAPTELETLLDMLQSRLREDTTGLAMLEHVRVRPCGDLDEEFLIRLIELRDFGLEVSVESMMDGHGTVSPV
ncbi:hypothetical protein B0H34DRAFT_784505 [Crassisporium funariophilum]|nr:hypothetical protein B0H34DRAFT_784505 [Crassisporium funariophilum]